MSLVYFATFCPAACNFPAFDARAAKSPLAIAGSKLALNHARDHGTAAALQQMTLLQSAIFDIDEMAVAIEAWKDKRTPQFEALHPLNAV